MGEKKLDYIHILRKLHSSRCNGAGELRKQNGTGSYLPELRNRHNQKAAKEAMGKVEKEALPERAIDHGRNPGAVQPVKRTDSGA